MDYVRLSRFLSRTLRHKPWELELELDEDGWVCVDQLINSLKESLEWLSVTIDDLYRTIEISDKKRFEISNGKIRALYGHSFDKKIVKEPIAPPQVLYHGTARNFTPAIKEKGLLPQSRQYVHLSVDTETALQVGKRRDNKPILLEIHAFEAWTEGVKFYPGNDKVWLADAIPSKYISFE